MGVYRTISHRRSVTISQDSCLQDVSTLLQCWQLQDKLKKTTEVRSNPQMLIAFFIFSMNNLQVDTLLAYWCAHIVNPLLYPISSKHSIYDCISHLLELNYIFNLGLLTGSSFILK